MQYAQKFAQCVQELDPPSPFRKTHGPIPFGDVLRHQHDGIQPVTITVVGSVLLFALHHACPSTVCIPSPPRSDVTENGPGEVTGLVAP